MGKGLVSAFETSPQKRRRRDRRFKAKMWGVIFITLVVVGFLAGLVLSLQTGDKRIRCEQDKDKSRLRARAEIMNRSAVAKLFDSLAGMFRRQL
jgi:hypothetical protein